MTQNLFAELPAAVSGEVFETLVTRPNLKIERIVSLGHASPEGFWYDQPQHEWVVVLTGAAVLRFEDSAPVTLHAGDWLEIPAHRRHRVDWTDPTQPTIWLAVHDLSQTLTEISNET